MSQYHDVVYYSAVVVENGTSRTQLIRTKYIFRHTGPGTGLCCVGITTIAAKVGERTHWQDWLYVYCHSPTNNSHCVNDLAIFRK